MNVQRILFVCLGNICRSPLVEAVARKRCAEQGLDMVFASCGTGGWHVGNGADPRMCAAAARAGYDLGNHRARQLREHDADDFDLLLTMDQDNLRTTQAIVRAPAKTALFLAWAGVASPHEFPDPYYGQQSGFDAAVKLAERGVDGLIQCLRSG